MAIVITSCKISNLPKRKLIEVLDNQTHDKILFRFSDTTMDFTYIIRTQFGAEPSGLFSFLSCQFRNRYRRRRATFVGRSRWHQLQVFARTDIEARHGYVVHAHTVWYRVVATSVKITDRCICRGRCLEYTVAADYFDRGLVTSDLDRTVVHSFIELYAFADYRLRWWSTDIDHYVLLVLSVADGPSTTAQPLTEPDQR